jgi:hypothetical protein
MRHGRAIDRQDCAAPGELLRFEFDFVAGEDAIDSLFVASQRGEFLRMSEPGFGSGGEWSFGGHVTITKNLIFELASAG